MEVKPLITLGLFSFNQESFLTEALDSINNQIGPAFNLWICDDHSNDLSVEVIKSYKFKNSNIKDIRYKFNNQNQGLARNLNYLLTSINTDWLIILAADDVLSIDSLWRYSSLICDDADVIWGNLEVIGEDSKQLGLVRPRDTWQKLISKSFLKSRIPRNSFIYWNNFVPGGMTLIRAEVIRKAEGWIPGVKTEDLGMWLKIRYDARFKYTPEIMGNYRVVRGSVSRHDIVNLYDQAELLAVLISSKQLKKFQGAILLSMRILYTVLNTKSFKGVNFFALCEKLGVSPIIFFISVPISITRPIYGSIYLQLKKLHRIKIRK